MKNKSSALLAGIALTLAVGAFIGCTTVRADQPHMQAALDALSTAEHELSIADEDKGGHRIAALRHVRAAITETHEGIAFARGH